MLAIIVPYRDREAHLQLFVAHVSTYFARDVLASRLAYRVIVAEQEPGLPFNKGALVNAAFGLAADADYLCIHDVDYLPIWADYSPPDRPMPIVWYGAEARPVAPGRSAAGVVHDLDNFFGAAVLVPAEHFRRVDGMSNEYWGWGIEDGDLRARFLAAGIEPGRRRGTFQALDHDSNGFFADGAPRPIGQVNQRVFETKWRPGAPRAADGLSTLRAEIVAREPVAGTSPERQASWERVRIRPLHEPTEAHLAALRPPPPGPAPARFGLGWTTLG